MVLLLFLLLVQAPGGGARPPVAAPPPRPSPTPTPSTGGPAGNNRGFDPNAYGVNIGLMLTGRVLLDTKLAPPEPVPVEYSCRGAVSTEWTNTKGAFQVYVGEQYAGSRQTAGAMPRLDGCQVSIRLPGYELISKSLSGITTPRGLDIGVLTLRTTGRPEGSAMSARSAAAPEKARREYIRALEDIGLRRFDDARQKLNKATRLFADYAAAHYSMGQVEDRLGNRTAARAAFERAAAADPQYVKPLIQLAELAAEDQDSATAARWAGKVNQLAPGVFPGMYLIEGGSAYNLDRYDEAARAARAGLAADPAGALPRLHKLLGEALYRLNDYRGAASELQRYLKLAADAPDNMQVAERARQCERLAQALQRQ